MFVVIVSKVLWSYDEIILIFFFLFVCFISFGYHELLSIFDQLDRLSEHICEFLLCLPHLILKLEYLDSEQVKGECLTKRRELLLQAGSVAFSLSAFTSIALAEKGTRWLIFRLWHAQYPSKCLLAKKSDVISDVPEEFRVYSDDVNKFKIMIPSGMVFTFRFFLLEWKYR